jgi:hypothetical protein
MKGRAEVFRLKSHIDNAFSMVDRIDAAELELRSHLARYLVVLVSGFMERAIQELAMQCCRRMSSGPALSFALARLDWSRNPTVDNVLALAGDFDPTWRNELEAFMDDEHRAAIGTVVARRNIVSHGGTTSLTYASVAAHYARIWEVIDFLMEKFDPLPRP